MLGAIGLMALNLGDAPVATVSFAVACCALGFGVVSYHPTQPYRAHMHHFVYRRVVRPLFPHLSL